MKFFTTWILLTLTAVACGDVLTLDDGTKVEGKAKKVGDQWIVTDAAGHETTVDPGRIVSFHLTGSAPDPAATVDRLAALRSSVENLADLQAIIDRYTQFIKQSAGSPQAAQAQDDLIVWQTRLSDNDKKAGNRWLSPMEWDVLAADEARDAQSIIDMIKRGDVDQASVAIKQALADDSDNPSALYLRGYLGYKNDLFVPAHADFEHVLKVIGDHAPTLNNLAVTQWRQHNYGAALSLYLKAMAAKPVDQAILDNVVEALQALPANMQGGNLAKKVQALFDDQDKQLQGLQQARGLYRWGSDWYPAAKVAQLTAEKQDHEQAMAALQTQVRQTTESLASTDAEMQNASHTIVAPPMVNIHRQIVDQPDPSLIRQQDTNLAQMDAIERTKLNNLRQQIRHLENKISSTEYTGVQRLIGPEGTPTRLPPSAGAIAPNAPTTQPGK